MGKKKTNSQPSKRITRSASKLVEIVAVKKLRAIENSEKTEARVTRSSKSKENNGTGEKVQKVEIVEKLAPRITRSSNKKPPTTVQPVAPPVEPKKKKAIVKRAEFSRMKSFAVNDLVLAKQKYSIPWPARILEVKRDKVLVFFFGDKREGFVPSSDIFDFIESLPALRSIVLTLTKKPRGFLTGIRDLELLLDVRSTESVLNAV